MKFIDTHCHVHSSEFFTPQAAEKLLLEAIQSEVSKILLVGTSLEDSKAAIEFAHAHPESCWASIGIHPHEATKFTAAQIRQQLIELEQLIDDPKVVAIGECGFDFYYNERAECINNQTALLRGQLEIAQTYGLPLSFHVREAFTDFWSIFEDYPRVKGVLHSFTDKPEHAQRAIKHGLYFGINGIATFTTHAWQRELFKDLPLQNIVVETDTPFLTPRPKRGSINSPENVIYITQYMAELRGESEELIAKATTANAEKLFKLT